MDQLHLLLSILLSKCFDRNQCIQIKTPHEASMSQKQIAAHLKILRKHVGYPMRRGSVTSQYARGQDPLLSSEDVDINENFVKLSSENRQMTHIELTYRQFKNLGVSETVFKNKLEKRDYRRHPTTKMPKISPEIKRKRRE